MQRAVRSSDRLDGANVIAARMHRQRQAGTASLAVDQDRAAAADAVLTADMGAGEPEFMAQEVAQQHAHADFAANLLTIDGERDRDQRIVAAIGNRGLHRSLHCTVRCCARCAAAVTVRRIKVASARLRVDLNLVNVGDPQRLVG